MEAGYLRVLVSKGIWRCLFCIRPAETVGAGYHGNFLDLLSDLGPRDLSQRLGNGRAIHLGGFSGPGDHSGPISGRFRRFRARPPICDLNIVTLPQVRPLRLQQCVLKQDRCLLLLPKTSVLSQQQTSVLSQLQTSVLSQQRTSILSQLLQCHNVQVADRRSGPKSTKMARNGSRMVARS